AVLSCYFPHYRKLHYWAKSTLFAPGLPRKILLDAGNIPVDRKTKDNQKLFAASFDALKCGEAIAVFPEGGSCTVHELPALKDGASWAALEYAKNLRDPAQRTRFSDGSRCDKEPVDVVICVAGIAYSDKTKYRASATMECVGPSLSLSPTLSRETVTDVVPVGAQVRPDPVGDALRRRIPRVAQDGRQEAHGAHPPRVDEGHGQRARLGVAPRRHDGPQDPLARRPQVAARELAQD
ncbi:uncharacterized protein RHOBADRAFT_18816, partial [Rhodotorula graminis WP1]